MTELYDITIIGGGPAGLFTAFYAGMRQAKTKIIESLSVLGGQPQLLYPEKNIYDVAGFPAISGDQLSKRLIQQSSFSNPSLCLEEEVFSYEKKDDGSFIIESSKGKHYTKTIVIAAGSGAFQARKLDLDQAKKFEGKEIVYYVDSLEKYRQKKVVIFGGGDSAVDWALALENLAEKVTLCHRRDRFRALDHSVAQLEASSVDLLTPYEPHKLIIEDDHLTAIQVKKKREEEYIDLEADTFIVNYGFQSNLGPLMNWPLKRDRQGILVNEKMETSVAGIYAVGDINSHPGKIKLIATAFGEAPIAVNHAIHHIHPEEHIQPIQSNKLSLE